MWNFYIARPGASASECIDWVKEGIKIAVRGPAGQWGECTGLVVTPGTRVRIYYPFRHERRTQEIIFPIISDPSIPTIHLDGM